MFLFTYLLKITAIPKQQSETIKLESHQSLFPAFLSLKLFIFSQALRGLVEKAKIHVKLIVLQLITCSGSESQGLFGGFRIS